MMASTPVKQEPSLAMMPGESLDAAAMMEADMSAIKSSPRSAAEIHDNLQPLSSKNQPPPQYRVGSYIPAIRKTSQAKKIMQADPQIIKFDYEVLA